MGDIKKFALLIHKLDSGPVSVRKKAVKALIQLKEPDVIPILENRLKKETSSAVRYYIRKGINFLEQFSHNYVKTAETIDGEDLENTDPRVRTEIVRKIVDFNRSEFLPLLLKKLETESNERVIATLVKAVGFFGTYTEVEVLRPFLRHHDLRIRANTIEALEMINDERVYPLILPFIKDPDNRIKANALKALIGYKKVEILSLLSEMLDSEEIWIRDSAVYALSNLHFEEVRELLRKAARDNIKAIRDKAALGLANLENDEIMKEQADRKIKKIVSEGVDELALLDTLILKERREISEPPPAQVQDELYQAVSDLDSAQMNKRKKAVILLGRLGDRRGLEPLYAALGDESKVVRYFAKKSIKQIQRLTEGIYQCPNCGFKRPHSDVLHDVKGEK